MTCRPYLDDSVGALHKVDADELVSRLSELAMRGQIASSSVFADNSLLTLACEREQRSLMPVALTVHTMIRCLLTVVRRAVHLTPSSKGRNIHNKTLQKLPLH